MWLHFLTGYGHWAWFTIAVALMALEVVMPGVHFLWFGVAAAIVGVLVLWGGFTWEWQIIAFGLISLLTVYYGRRLALRRVVSDEPALNVRGEQYVGRTFLVEEPIRGGRGKIRVGDTLWAAEGPDLPSGTPVKVTSTRGIVLLVQRA